MANKKGEKKCAKRQCMQLQPAADTKNRNKESYVVEKRPGQWHNRLLGCCSKNLAQYRF